MNLKFGGIGYALISLWFSGIGSVSSETPTPTGSPNPSSLSPDKKWEFSGGDDARLVKAGTNEVAWKLSEECNLGGSSENSAPLWAPDSKRFAFYGCGQAKEHLTLLYQLRDDRWVALKTPGDGDELSELVGNNIEAQAKKKRVPKETFLHMQSWTVEPERWLDSNTLVVYAAMAEVVHHYDGPYAGQGFGADLLVTLKLDDAGNWKIVKTHQMSDKEVQKRTKQH
jgi:hypothetical protein